MTEPPTSGPQTSGPLGSGPLARWKVLGRGDPVTLVVHGLGATEGEARIPAAGLPGTRVVVTLPGHGSAPDPDPEFWDYERVAADVRAVADEVGASRAVGVSLGAGALTRLAAADPGRFDRLALLLPAALDELRDERTRAVFGDLAEAVDGAREDGGRRLRALVAADLPAGVEVGDHVEQRVQALLRLREALRRMPDQRVVADASALAEVRSTALVVGGSGDPMHPAEVAEATVAALPDARLEIFPSPAPMLTHRRDLRAALVDFLG